MNIPTADQQVSLSARISTSFAPEALRKLTDWTLTQHLGSGSSADVWLLTQPATGRRIACKTPRSSNAAAILSQEAQLAAQLHHEHLVPLANPELLGELGQVPEATCWEYYAGGSLAALVNATGSLSLAQTVTVALPMAQVVQYLHAHQVVHGDIAPRNIVFDLTGRPVLIDLGGTRASAHGARWTGTPGFMAPEMLDHPDDTRAGLGAAADVYSLAALIWFCLSGSTPASEMHRAPLGTLVADLEQEIIALLESCLATEPDARPTIDEVVQAIGQWALPEPVELHAVVSEDDALLLPTRQPATRKMKKRFGRRKCRTRESEAQVRSHISIRLGLGFAIMVLAGGVAATVMLGPLQPPEQPVESVATMPDQPTPDYQAIIDQLAKARSHAWAAGDATLVEHYAAAGSQVFASDTEVLDTLAAQAHVLDGLRMRGVVEGFEHTADSTLVSVLWRTDPYVQRDANQTIVNEVVAAEELLRLELQDTDAGWRPVAVR